MKMPRGRDDRRLSSDVVKASESGGLRTVVLATTVNAVVAVAKLSAAAITGSSVMLAESFHALADTGNEALLMLAQHRGERAADDAHPLGFGREAYFWALIASVGVFVTGGLLSIREGVQELVHPEQASSFTVAYAVLGLAFVLELVSLLQAYHQLNEEAHRLSRDLLEQLVLTSDPTTRAVFGEDAAAVVGNVVAVIGVGLHQVTGSAIPDGLASLAVGLLLGVVAVQLARRNRDFLVGEQAPPPMRRAICQVIARHPGVTSVPELLVTFIGPRRLWVLVQVEVDPGLSGSDVVSLVENISAHLRSESPLVARADVVPITGPQPGDQAPLGTQARRLE